MGIIHLTVGETMFLRTVGCKYAAKEVFDCYYERDTSDLNRPIHKVSNSLLDEICSGLVNKGIFSIVDLDSNSYCLTEFGVNCYEAIMTKLCADKARSSAVRAINRRNSND